MALFPKIAVSLLAVAPIFLIGCGGGSTSPPPPPSGTTINAIFTGAAPASLAYRVGNGNWVMVPNPTNQLRFTIPQGATTYAIFYGCPTIGVSPDNTSTGSYVFEATIQDPTTPSLYCVPPPPSTFASPITVTGSVDASAIANTVGVYIYANDGVQGGFLAGSAGSFNAYFYPGITDIAAVAIDASNNVVGVKMVRSQTIPGVLNGGNPITFSPSDATTPQPISVVNNPWNNVTPVVSVDFYHGGFSWFSLNSSNTSYSAVSSSDTQSGDYYSFSVDETNAATGQSIGINQTRTNGSSVTLGLPAPLAYSAPTPSALPIFTITYSPSPGNTITSYGAGISYNASGFPDAFNFVGLSLTTTAAFQNGATTLTFPDLSSVAPGLTPPSGTLVNWGYGVSGGTVPPVNGSSWSVGNSGTYTAP